MVRILLAHPRRQDAIHHKSVFFAMSRRMSPVFSVLLISSIFKTRKFNTEFRTWRQFEEL